MRMGLVIVAALVLAGCLSKVSQIEEDVRRDMLDPDAVQFRNIESCYYNDKVWHGEFNAKNAYGAYTGFKSFYYADGDFATVEQGNFSDLMEKCYSKLPKSK